MDIATVGQFRVDSKPMFPARVYVDKQEHRETAAKQRLGDASEDDQPRGSLHIPAVPLGDIPLEIRSIKTASVDSCQVGRERRSRGIVQTEPGVE